MKMGLKWLYRISLILSTRAEALIILFALVALTGGIAVKFDLATAAIALGAILVLDTVLDRRAPPS